MKKASISLVATMLTTQAIAHPGAPHDHETLGYIEHLVLTALPIVVAAGLIGLLMYAYRRKA